MVKPVKLLIIVFALLAFSCHENNNRNKDIKEVAGNEEVLNFMKTFEGRGDLTDSSRAVKAHIFCNPGTYVGYARTTLRTIQPSIRSESQIVCHRMRIL